MTSIDDFQEGFMTGTEARPTQSWRHRGLLPTLIMVAALVAIVSSLGAPLIPTIARADDISLSSAQWLLTAALLTGAVATPIMGRLADGPRQRQVVILALAAVLAGCVLAAVSDSFTMIVVGRGLQGVGLGLLPVTMAIARGHLSNERSGRAIATLSVTAAVGVGLGYPLTGVITEVFNFHAAFWFGAILVAAALVVAMAVLPRTTDAPTRSFDTLGSFALSAVVIGVSVLLSEGGGWGWTSPLAIGIVVACIVVLAIWVRHELSTSDPLIDVRQVRNRSVLTADVSGFIMSVAMYLFLPVTVEFVQIPASAGYGFTASIVISSLVLVPLSAGSFLASRCLTFYDRRFGVRSMIPFGAIIFAVAAGFFAVEHRSLWEAFVAMGVAGLGIGFTFAAMPGFIVRAVPASETGSAMGFYQVLRSIGLSVGSAFSAAVLTAYTHSGHSLPTEEGFGIALYISSALCLLTAVLSYVLPGKVPVRPVTSDEEVDEFMEEAAELAGGGVMLSAEPPSRGQATVAE
jgi:MFS family permease